jgi:HEAT repeat protein
MSTRTVTCPDCRTSLKIPLSLPAHKHVKCPKCSGRFVPSVDEDAVDPGAASSAPGDSKSNPRIKTAEGAAPAVGAQSKSSPRIKGVDGVAPTPPPLDVPAGDLKPRTKTKENPPAEAAPFDFAAKDPKKRTKSKEAQPAAPPKGNTPEAKSFFAKPVGIAIGAAVLFISVSVAAVIYFNHPQEAAAVKAPAPGSDLLVSPKEGPSKDEPVEKGEPKEPANRQAEFRRLMDQGKTALAAKRHEDAVKAFEEAQQLSPEDVEVAKELAAARAGQEKDKVKADFNRFMGEGKVAYAKKKYDEAAQAFESAVRLNPMDAAAVQSLTEARDAMAAADPAPKPDAKTFFPAGPQPKDKPKDEPGGLVDGKTFAQWKSDLNHRDRSVRQHAVRVIGSDQGRHFGSSVREAVPDLIGNLRELDASLRGDAAAALGMIGAMEKIEDSEATKIANALNALLGTGESQRSVRLQAALAVAQMGPRGKGSMTNLADNAKDSYSWELRKASCYALGRIGHDKTKGPDPKAFSVLLGALKDNCGPVRLEAVLALSGMGTPSQPQLDQEKKALEPVLGDPDKVVAIWARVLLSFLDGKKFANPKSMSFLISFMHKDADPTVRRTAAQGLAILGEMAKEAIPELIKAYTAEKDLDVCLTIIGALGVMAASADSIQSLNEVERVLVEDKEAAARSQAATTLGKIIFHQHSPRDKKPGALEKRAKESLAKLCAALKDPEPMVVYAVVAALANIGGIAEPCLPALQDTAASHKEDTIKNAAKEAIKIINEARKKPAAPKKP